MTLMNIFSDQYLAEIVIKAIIVGVLVSLCASILGVSLVLKRLSMIGDGLSHVGFFALAVATVTKTADFKMEISLVIVVASALLIFQLKDSGKINGDSAVALVSTGAIAIGSLIFNFSGTRNADICNSLFGSASIIMLSDKEFIFSIILSVLCIILFILCYSKIFALTFDEDFAYATGVKTKAYKMLTSVLTAVIIVIGMEMMGAVMISALVVFPALTSMYICKSYKGVVISSAVLGVLCFVIGFFVACRFSLQTGPAVVSVHVVVFLIVAASVIITKYITSKNFSALSDTKTVNKQQNH